MNRKQLSIMFVFACLATAPLPAVAGGVPTKGVLGGGVTEYGSGVSDLGGDYRYTALPAGQGTLVSKIEVGTGTQAAFSFIDRRLVIPAVAHDGSPGGLSADGETLVLATPAYRFPQRESDFTVLDTRNLRVLDRLEFGGTFTYDAVSPDGGSLYLVEYTSPRNLTEYLVREYDLVRDRFNPEPIVDPNESAEEMYGTPITRETSPDGRWAYTLYQGNEHPFIHALDTERGEAVCIDLESVHQVMPFNGDRLDVSPDGTTLTVLTRKGPVEVVDTRTWEVAPAPEPADAAPATPADESGGESTDDGIGWVVLAGGLGLLAVAVALLARWRRREPIGETELERLVGIDGDGAADDAGKERERDPVA